MSLFNTVHTLFLQALIKNEVDFLLIGGYAVIFYGANRTTSDIDLLIRPDKKNGEKVIKTFIENGLDPGDLRPSEFEHELFLSFGFEPEAIDIMTFTKGITFEEAFSNSSNIDFDGINLKIIDIRDLIKNKLSLERSGTKALLDKYDALELQKILTERESNIMNNLTLENTWLKATFKLIGAELSSLVSKTNNTEHVWQADPTVWNRHAPILFPIVGQVENNTYSFNGQEYKMGQHGFARDKEFKVESQTVDSIVFSLESDEKTCINYPFQFCLYVTYTLVSDKLEIAYKVVNTDSQKIYFSLGAHPGLICPFQANETFKDYVLEFEKPETATRHFFSDGLLNGKFQEKYLDNSQLIPLSYDLFKNDAIILEGLVSEYVDLKSLKSNQFLRFYFKGFPLLAFWTKPGMNASFICIEPWFGVADVKGESKDFPQKPFVQHLEEGKNFSCQYSIQLSA